MSSKNFRIGPKIVCDGEADFKKAIKKMPKGIIADVTPVRHGKWEKQNGLYSCSECGKTCPYDVQADVIEYWACNYCPNCGAKMDTI
mgnify:CR=1 FL=1